MRKVAVVIPAYNAASTIGELVSGISRFVATEDIFVVDDGSPDGTDLVARDLGVWVMRHSKKKGKGVSLRDGCAKAVELNYEMVITIDSDLQHDPDQIPDFIDAASNLDVVVGRRDISLKSMPLHRYFSNTITSRMLSSRTGTTIEDSQCGYRLYRTRVLRSVDSRCRHFDYETDMLLKSVLEGYRVAYVPVKTIYNNSKSNIHIIDILRFIRVYLKSLSGYNGKIRTT